MSKTNTESPTVEEIRQARIKDGLCPDCGAELIHQEGIETCHNCGWTSVPC